jgi:hypothetical protein
MYTNGFHKDKVLSSLVGRLGWSDPSLNSTNLESRSGRHFDDSSFHTLITVQNIKDTAPETDWDIFFENKQKAVILKCLNSIFSQQMSDVSVSLYDKCGNVETKIRNGSYFTGFEIKVAPEIDTVVQLNSITLYLDGTLSVPIYIFKDGKVAPYYSLQADSVANEYTETDLRDQEIYLKYPGKYYVGYFQEDLGAFQAIQETGRFNRTYKFAAIPFYATRNSADFIRINLFYPGQPQGMNLNLSSFKDYTSQIINQAPLFDEAIGMAMAMNCLEQFLYCTTSNQSERVLKDQLADIAFDLNGTIPVQGMSKKQSLKDIYNQVLDGVRKAFYPNPKAQTINLC